MELTKEQADQIKQHLLGQLENFPEDKRDQIKEKIMEMNEEELSEFLVQNQLLQQNTQDPNQPQPQNPTQAPGNPNQPYPQCVFCSIINNEIPSYKLEENKDNIAILEINPLSKAHLLIVPKKHYETEKIPTSAFALAKKIARKIKATIKPSPQEIRISSQNMFGHGLVEVLPIYADQKIDPNKKEKASEEELKKLQEILKVKPRPIKISSNNQPSQSKPKKAKSNSGLYQFPSRIP